MKSRLQYFDVLKGVAIFLVVMGHVITMCVREIDRTPLFKFVAEIHMPLFFFISGWFSLKILPSGKLKKPDIGRRALQLLVPMAVVSSLWILYYPSSGLESPIEASFSGLWTNMWKNGYWFTLTLFEIILIFALLRPLYQRAASIATAIGVTVVAWLALFALVVVFDGTLINDVLGLQLVATYWPVFMAGLCASKHRDSFNATLSNGWLMTAALAVAAFSLYYICWWWEFPGKQLFSSNEYNLILARPVFHVAVAFVALAIFKPAVERASEHSRWVRVWSYIGSKSLGIYLLHYFFLFPLGFMRFWLVELNLAFVPVVVFSGLVAAMIVIVVLCLMRIVAISPLLDFLLTGNMKLFQK